VGDGVTQRRVRERERGKKVEMEKKSRGERRECACTSCRGK
jgi:hypothetical protein